MPKSPITVPADGLYNPESGHVYHFREFNRDRLIIGRARRCDIRINNPSVSSDHATIKRHLNGLPVIQNLSRNGTYLNGIQLTGRAILTSGTHVRFGKDACLVATGDAPAWPCEFCACPAKKLLEWLHAVGWRATGTGDR